MTELDDDKDIEAIKKSVADSSEDWRSQLVTKYQNLKYVAHDNLPGLWDSLEFELAIQKILNIADCTLPFAGIVLGSSSSLKTVGIELFRKWHNVFYTDSFSAKAFVSHSTAVKKEDLPKIDMLPKIKNKFLLTPELSPTFAKKDDDLIEILGILTRVLDGHGYESDTGAHGHRGYNESMTFAWAGAAVDIPYKVHKYLGTLGPNPAGDRAQRQGARTVLCDQRGGGVDDLVAKSVTLAASIPGAGLPQCHADHFTTVYLCSRN